MRETSQSRVEQTTNHTETLGSLSPAGGQQTVEVTEQDGLDDLADKRYFDADGEPKTSGPVTSGVEFPDYE